MFIHLIIYIIYASSKADRRALHYIVVIKKKKLFLMYQLEYYFSDLNCNIDIFQ